MSTRRFVLLSVSLIVLVAASAAEAQKWGRAKRPDAGACFFRDANLAGDYFCLKAGESLPDIPKGVSDRITSIQVLGRVGLTLFTQPLFKGGSATIAANVASLRAAPVAWIDPVSSIQVRKRPTSQEADRIVRRAYKELLTRAADDGALKFWIPRLTDMGYSEAQVREELIKSDEYKRLSSPKR